MVKNDEGGPQPRFASLDEVEAAIRTALKNAPSHILSRRTLRNVAKDSLRGKLIGNSVFKEALQQMPDITVLGDNVSLNR